MSCQTSVGRSGGKPSSGRLSEAHTVASVSSFRCLPSQEIPRIVVDCSRLSQRNAHGWAGVRLPVAVSLCIVLLISAYASALGKWHPRVRYVSGGLLFTVTVFVNIDIAPDPLTTNFGATGVQCGVQDTCPYPRQRLTTSNIWSLPTRTRKLEPPKYVAETRPGLSKMETPRIRLVVPPGYVSSSHNQFPFNGHSKPFTTATPGHRLLGTELDHHTES